MRNAGALGADGGDTESAKVTTADWAEDVQSGPPQQSPEGPRDAAQSHGPPVGWDILHRFMLMVVDECVEVPKVTVFWASDVGVQDDALVGELAIDVERCDV